MMAGMMLTMAGKDGKKVKRILESGKAYAKMKEIIKMQGKKIVNSSQIRLGKVRHDVVAKKNGVIKEISNRAISKISRVAGAPENIRAGIYLHKHVGDKVKKGDKLFTVYCHDKGKLEFVRYAWQKLEAIVVK